jgi:hypothetical protein
MKIAFDVKGTLEGTREKFVLALLIQLQEMGHECIVWSNSYGFAVDCVKRLGLVGVRAESKSDKWSLEEVNFYDVAIEDDHSQEWLAVKRIIFVDNPLFDTIEGVMQLATEIGRAKC